MTLFSVFVGALKDGVLLQGGHLFSLLNTTQSSVGVCCAATEVDAPLDSLLSSCSSQLAIRTVSNKVGRGESGQNKNNKCLERERLAIMSHHNISYHLLGLVIGDGPFNVSFRKPGGALSNPECLKLLISLVPSQQPFPLSYG